MTPATHPVPDRAPYKLPLSRVAFLKALNSGQGRAVEHVRVHGIGRFVTDVRHACLYEQALDPADGAQRVPWLSGLVAASEFRDSMPAELVAACQPDRTASPVQARNNRLRRGMMAALAAEGLAGAAEAMATVDAWLAAGRDAPEPAPLHGDEPPPAPVLLHRLRPVLDPAARHAQIAQLVGKLAPGAIPDGPEFLAHALYVYEHAPCVTCRQAAATAMADRDLLPDWVASELRADSARWPQGEG